MSSVGNSSPRVSYILAELEDVDNVFEPIKNASRVKYTCFDVSKKYIVFGTNAGGVVFLHHDTLSYIKTLTAKEGPVCQTAISSDENVIGFATSRGVVIVMEHHAERGAAQPQRLQISFEHRGTVLTALHWNVSSSKLYIGDEKGKVSVISVSTSRTRNIFQVPTTTIMKLDSKVIQMDFAQDHLLVSTLSRCYLCDTNKEQFLTIGKKLRDGDYGACFYPGQRSLDPCTIYSSRPGSRLWEADIKGNVCCTHQFKSALGVKPEKLYTFRNEVSMEEGAKEYKPLATNFHKLLLVWPSTEASSFVFTWGPPGVFVFDPKKAEVILWNEEIKGIKEAKCLKTDIYIHFTDGKFSKFSLMTVEQGICRLYQHGLAIHGAQLLLHKKTSLCSSRLNMYVPASFIVDMLQKASEMGKSYLLSGLTSVLNSLGLSPDKLSQSSRSSSAMSEPVRLNSGIYVVNKLMRDADDEASAPICLTRWRSASPVYRQNSRSPHSSPSRSSDHASFSPRSQRSSKTQRDPKVRSSGPLRTPDSTDSGTSGKVSEMSDETQSSPSRSEQGGIKPPHWQSWNSEQNTETKLSSEIVEQINGNSTNHASEPERVVSNGVLPNASVNSNFSNSTPTPSFSLNLQDISKQGNSGEKRVSFQTKVSTNGDESLFSPKLFHDSVNNGTNIELSPQYECPESLYDEYKFSGIALYGSMMMMPNLDMSVLFGSEADFQNIKESLVNKFSTGKNILMKNLKGLEQKLKQESSAELLDVRSKNSETTQLASPSLHSEIENGKSSEFQTADKNFWSFLPPLDSNTLIDCTKHIWTQTRDMDVLCHKSKTSSLLQEWVDCLHSLQITNIQNILSFLQNYHASSHSYKDDDTLRSTCSQITTSQESSPSDNCEISDRLEQEDPTSISADSKSIDEERHPDSNLQSLNAEISESSTLRTESIWSKLVNLEDFVFVYSPFRTSAEDYHMMSDLTMMCFQMNILGKINEVMKIHSNILKVKEKLEELQKLSDKREVPSSRSDQELADSLKDSTPLKHSESAQSFSKSQQLTSTEQFLEKRYSQASDLEKNLTNGDFLAFKANSGSGSLNLLDSDDARLSYFLQNYFHLFDIQRLRELLNLFNQPCIKTWTVMLAGVSSLNGADEFTRKLAADQFETAASYLERNYFGPLLISHLLRIFKVNSTRGIELCLQRSYHITPLDVLYLSKSTDSHPKFFLQYIFNILDCLPENQKPKVLEKLLHLKEVHSEWIQGVLKDDVSANLKCTCGWPKPGSHLYSWNESDLLLYILSSSKQDAVELLEKCFNCGFWLGYLLLLKKLDFRDVHKKVIIQLADISLLSEDNQLGYLPLNFEEWLEFFELYAQSFASTDSIACLMCDQQYNVVTEFKSSDDSQPWSASLQWESLSKAALAHLDSFKVLDILQSLDIPNGALSTDFYRRVMMSVLIDKQQSALIHRTLNTVGSYLWSRKLQCVSPEVSLVLQREKEKPSASNSDVSQTSSMPSCSYFEEPQGHWGVKIAIQSDCKVCKMPLTSHVSSGQGGVTIYKCGHSYHTACSKEGFCVLCFHSHDEAR